jgi:choline dehydrogenase-like flavoprotein
MMVGQEPASGGTAFVQLHEGALLALVDTIVPADDHPSGGQAGGLEFLARILTERPDWIERVERVLFAVHAAGFPGEAAAGPDADGLGILDSLLGDPDYLWFAQLVNAGFYADAGNGGNRDAASWSMVGWRRDPVRSWTGIAELRPARDVVVGPGSLLGRYDAIVIGSGAGGGVAACALAEDGRTVLVVEAGGWPDTATLATDHLHNPRSTWGVSPRSGPVDLGNPRVVAAGAAGEIAVRPSDPRWSNNAMTVGGGTRVYGAQAWRFTPKDFAMASSYGVPDGSSLADWPIGYDDLEPYYQRAEWEIGVSGDSTDGAHAGHRGRGYPMPPLPAGADRSILQAGADALGIATLAVPLLVNSQPYLGRAACAQCAMCVGFACPVDAKNGSQNTVLDRAFATGRCSISLETQAARLTVDAAGRITGVSLVGMLRDGTVWTKDVAAAEVVVSAGAVESARLLLNSTSDREPDGIGNNTDQVGRHLQGHLYGGAVGVFDDLVNDLVGPGPSIATADYRHGNAGLIGGGIIANEFVPTPSNSYQYLVGAGLIPAHGPAAKQGMRELPRRMVRLMGPIQEVTTADARVRVDRAVRDRFTIPVARLSGSVHPEDVRARDFTSDRSAEWLRASGAGATVPLGHATPIGPSGGQHQAGTCRMGTDPATSVTDPWGRVWGHDNLRVADGSLHVTNGGVNPVLTIFANAMRVMDAMVRD